MKLIRRIRHAIRDNEINVRDADGDTLLHRACRSNDLEAVQLLITNGVSILRDACENTPLHIAMSYGNEAIIRSLIAYDQSQVLSVNRSGQLPVIFGRINNIKVLMEYLPGLNIDTRDYINRRADSGANILHYVITDHDSETVKYLLEHKIDTTALDHRERTPLAYATQLSKYNDDVRLKDIVWLLQFGVGEDIKCAVEE
jgi:ankyrin repeat protein